MTRKLHNYLRTYRKRAALSQDEVAFLLGMNGGAKISRHERRSGVPTLETALAYEALYGVPVRELYAGVYEKVEQEVKRRARTLAGRLDGGDPVTGRKLERLPAVSSGAANPS